MFNIVKHDKEKDAIVYFDQSRGTKVRMAKDGVYTKSTTPELVDLKITNYCAFGCKHCYMGSTTEGQHASYSKIVSYLKVLGDMSVFEVAIGGGEPTTHPRFCNILNYARYAANIVPNFTTFTDDWLTNGHIVEAVNEKVGGIGVSVYSKQSLNKFHNIRKTLDMNVQVTPQHVVGQVPFKTTNELVKSVNKILLLGYKNVGFGVNKKERLYTDDQIKELFSHGNIISVDTAFLENYEHVLDEIGIPLELRSSPEGKFSCYIDAVEYKMGPSSYVDENKLDDLTFFNFDVYSRVKILKESFLKNYKGY